MAFGGASDFQRWSRPLGHTRQRGSIPLVVLVAGVGFAVATGAMVRMSDRLRGDSEARKREAAEQGNRSAVAVLKQLLSSVDGSLPAVFPDPYIRNVTDSTTRLAKRTDLMATGWSLDHRLSFSELTVLTVDPGKADFSKAFAGETAVDAGRSSKVRISKLGLTNVSNQVAYVDSIETTVQVPDPVNAAKVVTTKVRMELPVPLPPTCRIQVDSAGIQMMVSGAALQATVRDSDSGIEIGSYDRSKILPGAATADSIFGEDVEIFRVARTALPAALVDQGTPLTLVGEVRGVAGSSTACSATLPGGTTVPPTPTPQPVDLACQLRLKQGVLNYMAPQQVIRRPELIVKVRNNVELLGNPRIIQLGSGETMAGTWSKLNAASPGCGDPPCHRATIEGARVLKPGLFVVEITDRQGNSSRCRAFNYGAWDGTWRAGPMAYSEAHIGSWAKAAAKESGIPLEQNPRLRASNTIAYSAANIERLCALKGMKPYSSDSQGSEKRRNYTSCHDDSHWTFVVSKMIQVSACTAQWIATLICN